MRDGAGEMIAVLTRARHEDDELVRQLRSAGARIIELPCVHVERLPDPTRLVSAVAALEASDWLVVTSPAGADAVARIAPPRARVAAVGAATAARLAKHGIVVAFVPGRAMGADLARELPAGGIVLLARSDRALPDMPRILRERGFHVREVVAYRTRTGAEGDVAGVRSALASGARVEIHVASPSALDGLLDAIEPGLVGAADIVASGPTTLAAVRARLGPGVSVRTRDEEVSHVAHG